MLVLIVLGVILIIGVVFFVRRRMGQQGESRRDAATSYDNSYRIACDRFGVNTMDDSFRSEEIVYGRNVEERRNQPYKNYEYRY